LQCCCSVCCSVAAVCVAVLLQCVLQCCCSVCCRVVAVCVAELLQCVLQSCCSVCCSVVAVCVAVLLQCVSTVNRTQETTIRKFAQQKPLGLPQQIQMCLFWRDLSFFRKPYDFKQKPFESAKQKPLSLP